MAEDGWSKLTTRLAKQPEGASTPPPTLPPSLVEAADTRQAYVAFDNKVRTMNIEIRCYATGLSYSIPFAHMSGLLFEFLTGERMQFSGGGFGFTIEGRNLRDMLLGLNLHTCTFIQDYSAAHHTLPQPLDPTAAFVARITVEVLRPTPMDAKAAASIADREPR